MRLGVSYKYALALALPVLLCAIFLFQYVDATNNVAISATAKRTSESFINVNVEFANRGKNDIWLCVNNGVNERLCEIRQNGLILSYTNVPVPPDLFLNRPFYAKYMKVPSSGKLMVAVTIEFPITEKVNPFVHSERSDSQVLSKASQLTSISLVFAYYSALREVEKLCIQTSESTFVVEAKWASANTAKTMRVKASGLLGKS
jgi:hypothetical protein